MIPLSLITDRVPLTEYEILPHHFQVHRSQNIKPQAPKAICF